MATSQIRLTDEALLARFRAGDEAAFAELHARWRPQLVAYANRILASEADAEDVVQDVFVRAHAALAGDERPVVVGAWLRRVTRNRCLDVMRGARPSPGLEADTLPGRGLDPHDSLLRREQLREVVADVRRLPERQRDVLLGSAVDGASHEDLARRLWTDVPGSRSLLRRARHNLVRMREARAADCREIRREVDRARRAGNRVSEHALRHLQACETCAAYRAGERRPRAAILGMPWFKPVALLATAGAATGGGLVLARDSVVDPARAPQAIAGGLPLLGQRIVEGTDLPPGFALVTAKVALEDERLHRITLRCPRDYRVSGLAGAGQRNLRQEGIARGLRGRSAVLEWAARRRLPPGSTATVGVTCLSPALSERARRSSIEANRRFGIPVDAAGVPTGPPRR